MVAEWVGFKVTKRVSNYFGSNVFKHHIISMQLTYDPNKAIKASANYSTMYRLSIHK